MKAISFLLVTVMIMVLQGCSGPGLSASILGEQLIGSGWSAQARNNTLDYMLVNPTVNGQKFANGTSKKPIPVELDSGEECRAPLPSPAYRYTQYAEFRFDVVRKFDGKICGYVSKKYTIPSESGGSYHRPPITFPVWAVKVGDIHFAE